MSSQTEILGGPSADETSKRIESAIHAQMEALAAKHEAKVLEGVAEMIGRYEAPQRPEYLNGRGESMLKMQSPTSGLYRNMSEAERAIRNPDSDHWMADFSRGFAVNDRAVMLQANAKLDAMFPNLRATDLLEGASSTTGGFGDGSGAVYLPRPLEELVAINRDRTAKMWRYATTYQMTTQNHNVPTGGAMTAYMMGEATTPGTWGWTAAQVPLIAYPAIAKAILGNDMLADSAVNLVSFLTRRGGAALGVLEDQQFFRDGNGTGPNVTCITGTAYAEATTNALAYADVVGMFFAVNQEYRDNARWFMATDVLKFLSGVKATDGRPLYAELLMPPQVLSDTPTGAPDRGAQGTIFGRPVHDVPMSNGNIWFGDPAATYAIGRRQGITVESSRDFHFDTRRTMFLLTQRIAGNNIESTSARLAAGITSATV